MRLVIAMPFFSKTRAFFSAFSVISVAFFVADFVNTSRLSFAPSAVSTAFPILESRAISMRLNLSFNLDENNDPEAIADGITSSIPQLSQSFQLSSNDFPHFGHFFSAIKIALYQLVLGIEFVM